MAVALIAFALALSPTAVAKSCPVPVAPASAKLPIAVVRALVNLLAKVPPDKAPEPKAELPWPVALLPLPKAELLWPSAFAPPKASLLTPNAAEPPQETAPEAVAFPKASPGHTYCAWAGRGASARPAASAIIAHPASNAARRLREAAEACSRGSACRSAAKISDLSVDKN